MSAPDQRLALMLEQRAEGWSYARIGEWHGISAQRVGQILKGEASRQLIRQIQTQK